MIKSSSPPTLLPNCVDVILAFGNKTVRDRLIGVGPFPGLDNTRLPVTAMDSTPGGRRGLFVKFMYDLPLGKTPANVFEATVAGACLYIDAITMSTATSPTGDIRQTACVYLPIETEWDQMFLGDAAVALQRFSLTPPLSSIQSKPVTAFDDLPGKPRPKSKLYAKTDNNRDRDGTKNERYRSPSPNHQHRGRGDEGMATTAGPHFLYEAAYAKMAR